MPRVMEQIKALSHEEKLQALDWLWMQIVNDEEDFASPAWHAQVLEETERRVEAGLERFIPWEQAKAEIRAALA